MSSKNTLRLLVCLCMLSMSLAAPIRMSAAAKRKSNTIQLNKKLSHIASLKNQRQLKKKKPHPHPRHSHNKTNSCLSYTCSELESQWNFPGEIPDCPGKNCDWSGGGSGGSGGSGGGGNSTTSGNSTETGNSTEALTDDTTSTDDGAGDDDTDANENQGDDSVDDAYYKEITDFDLGNCTSFSDYWLWDLGLTCDDQYNLTNCECTSAAILMSKGLLECPDGSEDSPYCPSNCAICNTCLSLLGCSETKPPNRPNVNKFNMSMIAYILAAVAGILLGVVAVMVHQKKTNNEKPLEENLVAGAVAPAGDGAQDNVWLAPVSE